MIFFSGGREMRRILIALTVLLAFGMTATAAMAQNIPVATNLACAPNGAHFAQDAVAPTCTITTNPATNTISVSCTGTQLQGVGNTNALTSLEVDAEAQILCHNPGSKDKLVEPHTADITADNTNEDTPSRNGRIAISPISVTVSEADVEQQFECPNPSWREEVTTLTVTSVVYTVRFASFNCDVFSATFPAP
jgi:hypothetical protein